MEKINHLNTEQLHYLKKNMENRITMTTPKQRLIKIIQSNIDTHIENVFASFYLTPEQTQELITLSKEQDLAAEVVTNAYVLNMSDEEMEDYVTAIEKVYSYQEKVGATIVDSTEKVMERFMETNQQVFLKNV
ncbi:hypothetical protein VPIG_00102 [Vibrio phage PWH3a-P1]|uniref:hypothetical protein n=1 Tax=Vibrio phage PWH3a-P1 TaxID=754058 RepID=UPI0002C13316|nr:hypothetical protein VPIG_00102 [Vibrio phage PWH3a-P1]AGH31959.1 hypothetical protein VPIG_00102 [Vibrio phage PWH3a-P1]